MLLSVFDSGRLRCAFIGVALPLKVAKSKWVYSLMSTVLFFSSCKKVVFSLYWEFRLVKMKNESMKKTVF
jgi:hypothetical protein